MKPLVADGSIAQMRNIIVPEYFLCGGCDDGGAGCCRAGGSLCGSAERPPSLAGAGEAAAAGFVPLTDCVFAQSSSTDERRGSAGAGIGVGGHRGGGG